MGNFRDYIPRVLLVAPLRKAYWMWTPVASRFLFVALLFDAALSTQTAVAQAGSPTPPDFDYLEEDLSAEWSTTHLCVYEAGVRRFVDSLNQRAHVYDVSMGKFLQNARDAREVEAVGRLMFPNCRDEYPVGYQGELPCVAPVEWKHGDEIDRATVTIHVAVMNVESGIIYFEGGASGGLSKHSLNRALIQSGAIFPRRAPASDYILCAALTITTQDDYTQLLDVKCHKFKIMPKAKD